jgi:DNA-binding LacI/PurR family transcriptional regulator
VAKAPRTGSEIMMVILGAQGLDWVLHCAPVYAGVLHGIEAAVADQGHRMLMRQATDWSHLGRILKAAPPMGLITLGFEPNTSGYDELSTPALQIPAVWTMGSPLHFHGDRVQPDHMAIGVAAGQHLLSQGHRHCALIGSSLGSPAALMSFRNDSFRWVVESGGGDVMMLLDTEVILRDTHEHKVNGPALDALVERFLQAQPRPSALFLESDMLAPGVYQRLTAAGLKPQRDVMIVTCNNEHPYLAALEPKPTVIDIQPQVIGRRTVDQLLWRTANLHAPLMRLLVEPILVTH